ncbi:phage NrS-1 polymerase family protein [Dictyobacter formicarum]|uniref:NrS-1 polymerase-like HBD domain-containing protein n=1 Tax=Dictyobacter formicarum TaxID=2778368 RepID=A0ABQ3VHC9_9CHLR|nr:hypothetical protein [Dictyobacter formicarum]GHO85185.1 hypothetical protein KSZ_31910 [Dictyobacter formicarum]
MEKEGHIRQHREVPTPLEVQFSKIPQDLKEIPQWVMWKYLIVSGEITKPPFDAATGKLASVANRNTWSTFTKAQKAYEEGRYSGVGFMLTPESGLVGIDIDHCLESGQSTLEAQTILQKLNTYKERSPSGKGIRIFLKGSLPGVSRKKGNIELYQEKRYLTVTGQQLADSLNEIAEQQRELNEIYTSLFPHTATKEPQQKLVFDTKPNNVYTQDTQSDESVLQKALKAANGQTFQRYFAGDPTLWEGKNARHPSHSEADFALCLMLSFWTKGDHAQIDRLFRRSGLIRPKWDRSSRGIQTYGDLTIEKAIQQKANQ